MKWIPAALLLFVCLAPCHADLKSSKLEVVAQNTTTGQMQMVQLIHTSTRNARNSGHFVLSSLRKRFGWKLSWYSGVSSAQV